MNISHEILSVRGRTRDASQEQPCGGGGQARINSRAYRGSSTGACPGEGPTDCAEKKVHI